MATEIEVSPEVANKIRTCDMSRYAVIFATAIFGSVLHYFLISNYIELIVIDAAFVLLVLLIRRWHDAILGLVLCTQYQYEVHNFICVSREELQKEFFLRVTEYYRELVRKNEVLTKFKKESQKTMLELNQENERLLKENERLLDELKNFRVG